MGPSTIEAGHFMEDEYRTKSIPPMSAVRAFEDAEWDQQVQHLYFSRSQRNDNAMFDDSQFEWY